VSVDALGNPLRFTLTGGHRHDITQAEALLVGLTGDSVPADRGDDADDFITFMIDQGSTPVIPSRKRRKQSRDYDTWLYRERALVECFINKIKHFRRIFSRFENLARRYLGFLNFAAVLI
jgi:transposase